MCFDKQLVLDICDIDKMHSLMHDLEGKVAKFTAAEQSRKTLLQHSVLFHTHYKELTAWYLKMSEKYQDRTIDLGVVECEKNKERFILETDETAQAYAMTMGEGKGLIKDMIKADQEFDMNHNTSIAHVHLLLDDIGESLIICYLVLMGTLSFR